MLHQARSRQLRGRQRRRRRFRTKNSGDLVRQSSELRQHRCPTPHTSETAMRMSLVWTRGLLPLSSRHTSGMVGQTSRICSSCTSCRAPRWPVRVDQHETIRRDNADAAFRRAKALHDAAGNEELAATTAALPDGFRPDTTRLPTAKSVRFATPGSARRACGAGCCGTHAGKQSSQESRANGFV